MFYAKRNSEFYIFGKSPRGCLKPDIRKSDKKFEEEGLSKENAQVKLAEALKLAWMANGGREDPKEPEKVIPVPNPEPKVETFQDRCRALGSLSRKFVNK